MLQAHQKDLHKLLEYHNVSLRFVAHLVDERDRPDPSRRFVLSFYLADGTISISEPNQRAFTIGVKRLDRTKVLKPGFKIGDAGEDRYYDSRDLEIGKRVDCFGFVYELCDADDFVFEWMEKDGRLNVKKAEERGREEMQRLSAGRRVEIERELRAFDKDKNWTVERDAFLGYLRKVWGHLMSESVGFGRGR